MVEERRDVVVEKDTNQSPLGWIIGLVVLIVLLLLFFMSGGFGLFSGTATQGGGDTTNVEAPDTVNVQPPAGQ
jgi:hypothetical protein